MAISSVSKPTNLAQWVDPLDTDALSKALAYKQQKFDQGVQQIQSEISTYQSQVGNLFRESDQQYLQSKVDEYVNTVNSKFGGADFSEASTIGNVSRVGSVIYKDDRIINAIKDSRAISNLLQGYQKMKADPKLMQYYSPANEAWDMSAVQRYKDNPEERYNGSSNPTPYSNNQAKTEKITQKIEADAQTILGKDGYMTYIKGVGGEKVRKIVQNQLNSDPSATTQMNIDAWYSYRNATPEAVQAEYQRYKIDKASVYDNEIQKLTNSKLLLDPKSKAYATADKNITYLQNQKADMLTNLDSSISGSVDRMKGYLYQQKYIDGFVAAKSYQQETLKSDPTWIANQRMAVQKQQFRETIGLRKAQIERDDFWKVKNYELDVNQFNYKKEQDARELAFKREEAARKESESGGSTSTPLYSGQLAETTELNRVQDLEVQMNNLREDNQLLMSNAVIDVIVGNDYNLESQRESIKRIIGSKVTNPQEAFRKLQANQNGLNAGVKARLNSMQEALFSQMNLVAKGKMSLADFNKNNVGVFSEAFDQVNTNAIKAYNLSDIYKKAQDQAYTRSGITPERRTQIQRTVQSYRLNPSAIPQEYIVAAQNALGINTSAGGDQGLIAQGLQNARNIQNPVSRRDPRVIQRAIELYQTDAYDIDKAKFNEFMKDAIPQDALSRRTFSFNTKQVPNAERALIPQVLDMNGTLRKEVEGGKQLELGRFSPRGDGSFDLEVRTFTGEGNTKKYDPTTRVVIPANQSQSITQFAGEDFGTYAPNRELDKMIQNRGGLFDPSGNIISLTTTGGVPLNYTLKAANPNNKQDTSVRVMLQRVDASGNETWVPANGLVYPNADSAKYALRQIANGAESKGFKNVQELVKFLTK